MFSIMLGNWQLFHILWSKNSVFLKLFRKLLTGFRHAFNPDGLKNTLSFSRLYPGMAAARAGIVGIYIPRTMISEEP